MRLHFEELGEGFPLVLLHGHTLDRRMWHTAAPGLAAAGFRVIMPDLAGHGLSGPPAADSTPAGDLADLLRDLGIDKAIIAGLSQGGAVAINFALRFPELCAALIPIDAALFGHRFAQWPGTKPYIALARSEGLASGLQAWLLDPLFASALASTAAPLIREMVGQYPGHAWLEQAPSPVPPGPLDAVRLGEIAAPTLVLTGEHDLPDFLQISEKLAAEIPGSHRRVISGAGHLVPLEQPKAFTAAVLQFLDDLNRR